MHARTTRAIFGLPKKMHGPFSIEDEDDGDASSVEHLLNFQEEDGNHIKLISLRVSQDKVGKPR